MKMRFHIKTRTAGNPLAEAIAPIVEKNNSVAIVGAKVADISICINAIQDFAKAKNRHWKNEYSFITKGNNSFDELTVAESIFFGCSDFFGIHRKEKYELAEKTLDEFGIRIDLKAKMQTLRVSDKKMVEVLRAYLACSAIVVFEDTMSEVGFRYSEIFIRMIKRLYDAEAHRRIIYCTTKWEDAIKIANQIIVITNNRIQDVLEQSEVIKNPRVLVRHLLGEHVSEASADDKDTNYFEVLNTIFKGAELLSSSFELESALVFIAENIKKTLECAGCFIYLRDLDDRESKVIAYSDDYTKQMGIDINYESVREYFNTNRDNGVLYISDHERIRDFVPRESNSVQSLFGFPILLKSIQIGYMIAWYDHYYVYSEKQLLILSAYTNEVAIIFETAKLMNRSLLLQESHHRIKNNLQMIISLLYMQKEQMKKNDEPLMTNDVIKSMVSRIKSIAVVHDLLTGTQNNQIVNARNLFLDVLGFYRCDGIKITTNIDEIYIAQKNAVSIALIMNELINNCMKHAFLGLPESQSKTITIVMKISDNVVYLSIKDNGVGIKSGIEEIRSLGMTIVKMLVEQEFKGEISVEANEGTIVEIILPKGNVFSNFVYLN